RKGKRGEERLGLPAYPGCAARPWAWFCNAVGVKTFSPKGIHSTAQGRNEDEDEDEDMEDEDQDMHYKLWQSLVRDSRQSLFPSCAKGVSLRLGAAWLTLGNVVESRCGAVV